MNTLTRRLTRTAPLSKLPLPTIGSISISRPTPHRHQPTSLYHATSPPSSPDWHGTTIVCVRKNGRVCMMGDGMVSMGSVIVKPNAKKIRRIYPKTLGGDKLRTDGEGTADADKQSENEGTIVGFAGTTADAFTLLERLEGKLDEYPGQLARSCVELAKGWRTDKYLRRLEASLLVADKKASFEITGNGDVLESHDGVLGVGSGSSFAIGEYIVEPGMVLHGKYTSFVSSNS